MNTVTEQPDGLELVSNFFQTEYERARLREIIEFGVGPHISLQDFSINPDIWIIDQKMIGIWNGLTREERKAIIKALRKERYQDWALLERAIESGNPLSVIFDEEEIYYIRNLISDANLEWMVDCVAIIVNLPSRWREHHESTSFSAVQIKWNSLPKDLRMKMRDEILRSRR